MHKHLSKFTDSSPQSRSTKRMEVMTTPSAGTLAGKAGTAGHQLTLEAQGLMRKAEDHNKQTIRLPFGKSEGI